MHFSCYVLLIRRISKGISMTTSSLSIMIVDDDELMLMQAKAMIAQLGNYEITLCNSWQSALSQPIKVTDFDFIILDLNMPQTDGIEVMRELAEMDYKGALALFSAEESIILKTALHLATRRALNVVGSLSKPLKRPTIEQCLSKAVNLILEPKNQRKQATESISKAQLQEAIDKKLIEPYFQPKVCSATKQVLSVESLARWPTDNGRLIPPIAFIPVAENEGLIHELSLVLFDKTLLRFKQFSAQCSEITCGFNVSTDSLNYVKFPELLSEICNQHNISPKSITLEITESKLIENIVTGLDVLTRLRLKGFGLSIDDFGTGYSSLNQLTQVPFTELKIDRGFVNDAKNDRGKLAILETSASLAKRLHLKRVAEGVETQEDWDTVAATGCEMIQGYFVAKPMPADEFSAWLLQWNQSNQINN